MYVNAYILGVPEEAKDSYTEACRIFGEIAKEYGALEIYENWEKEVPDGEVTDFRRAIKAEPGEKIVMSWVIWPDRKTGDAAHKGMYTDPRMEKISDMPIDGKRMVIGGFEPIFSYHKD